MKLTRPSPPEIDARRIDLARELGEEITHDALTGTFTIFQRRRGHRHSTDDLLTAVYAVRHGSPARADDAEARPLRLLDLGTGIGGVGLAVLSTLLARGVDATSTVVEVQEKSFRILGDNIWQNGVGSRVRAIHGDLRTSVPNETFDLVTGSPPYFDVSTGIVSADSQRAAARFELHGDVGDYCRAAARAMHEGARFVFCFPTNQRARAEAACAAAGLGVVRSQDVIPREGATPLFSLFACVHSVPRQGASPSPSRGGHERERDTPHRVRAKNGEPTEEHLAAREVLGFPGRMGHAARS